MKMLSNTETELKKKNVAYKKACIRNPVKHVKCSFLRKKVENQKRRHYNFSKPLTYITHKNIRFMKAASNRGH